MKKHELEMLTQEQWIDAYELIVGELEDLIVEYRSDIPGMHSKLDKATHRACIMTYYGCIALINRHLERQLDMECDYE